MARKGSSGNSKSKDPIDQLNAIFKQHKLTELKTPTEEDFDVPRIPWGFPEIDEITGGGLPEGVITVIWGPEKSGKSSLAIKALAEAQAVGKKGFYYDLERGINKEFATSLGLNLTNGSVIVKPQTEGDVAEVVFDVITDIIKSTDIDVIVLDSVTALVPRDVQEGSAEDNTIGLVARILSSNLPKIATLIGDYNKTLIIISQEREVIGARTAIGMPTPTAMTGGRALKFYNSLTLYAKPRFTKKTDRPDFYENERRIGHILKVTVQKSRVCMPNGEAEVDFYYQPIRRILGLLKSNYGSESLIKMARNNYAKFSYTDREGKEYSGLLSEKKDWERLLIWFKENKLLYDFLAQIKETEETFFKILLEDGDIDERTYKEWIEFPEAVIVNNHYPKGIVACS